MWNNSSRIESPNDRCTPQPYGLRTRSPRRVHASHARRCTRVNLPRFPRYIPWGIDGGVVGAAASRRGAETRGGPGCRVRPMVHKENSTKLVLCPSARVDRARCRTPARTRSRVACACVKGPRGGKREGEPGGKATESTSLRQAEFPRRDVVVECARRMHR